MKSFLQHLTNSKSVNPFEQAKKTLEKALAGDAQAINAMVYFKGFAQLSEQDIKTLLTIIDEAILKNNQNGTAYYLKGKIGERFLNLRPNQRNECLTAYIKATELEHEDAMLTLASIYHSGSLSEEFKDIAKAIAIYEKLITKFNNPFACLNLGNIYCYDPHALNKDLGTYYYRKAYLLLLQKQHYYASSALNTLLQVSDRALKAEYHAVMAFGEDMAILDFLQKNTKNINQILQFIFEDDLLSSKEKEIFINKFNLKEEWKKFLDDYYFDQARNKMSEGDMQSAIELFKQVPANSIRRGEACFEILHHLIFLPLQDVSEEEWHQTLKKLYQEAGKYLQEGVRLNDEECITLSGYLSNYIEDENSEINFHENVDKDILAVIKEKIIHKMQMMAEWKNFNTLNENDDFSSEQKLQLAILKVLKETYAQLTNQNNNNNNNNNDTLTILQNCEQQLQNLMKSHQGQQQNSLFQPHIEELTMIRNLMNMTTQDRIQYR